MTYAVPPSTAAATTSKEHRPIFVVGFQRSGTTLLQALLGAHPRIASPPETYFFFRVYHLRDFWGDLKDDARLRRVVHEMLNPMVPLFAESGFDEDDLFEQLKGSDRSYRALFDTMMRDFAQRNGKRRWSEKTPGQSATDVWELFPEAQVVHIVRDPRDVVLSSVSMPWERDDPAIIAQRYVEFTLDTVTAGTARGPAQYLRIRYEDLCQDPAVTLRLICSFLSEDYDPLMVSEPSRRMPTVPAGAAPPWQRRALDAVSPEGHGDRRKQLGAISRARVAAVVAPLLGPYGYRRPRAINRLAGTVLNIVFTPAELAVLHRGAAEARRSAHTPDARYAAVQRFQEEMARRVEGTWPEVVEPVIGAPQGEKHSDRSQTGGPSEARATSH
jgi:hypothetical protein